MMGAHTHGPIYQGYYIHMVILSFHLHVNLGLEAALYFLRFTGERHSLIGTSRMHVEDGINEVKTTAEPGTPCV